jgi:hypothetical protein
MTSPVPAPVGGSPDRRVVLAVVLGVLLLLLASCGAYALGRSSSQSLPLPVPVPEPTGSPGGSALPTPAPTVTATPSPTLPSTGGGSGGSGGTTGGGSGGGNAVPGDSTSDGSGDGTVEGTDARPFTMTASLGGAPVLIGETRDLVVTVRNPNGSALDLRSVTATPRTPSATGCLASWVSVGSYDASRDAAVRVPARGTATVTLTFELVNLASVDQNACQGASFPLTLGGSGRLV